LTTSPSRRRPRSEPAPLRGRAANPRLSHAAARGARFVEWNDFSIAGATPDRPATTRLHVGFQRSCGSALPRFPSRRMATHGFGSARRSLYSAATCTTASKSRSTLVARDDRPPIGTTGRPGRVRARESARCARKEYLNGGGGSACDCYPPPACSPREKKPAVRWSNGSGVEKRRSSRPLKLSRSRSVRSGNNRWPQ
jgi:hypothetical protein